jgi:hypothetical protein
MLLRRNSEHLRTQTWFAAAIEFEIVVVRIFVGLQVSKRRFNLRPIVGLPVLNESKH